MRRARAPSMDRRPHRLMSQPPFQKVAESSTHGDLTEPLHRPTLLAPVAAWPDDSPNILPVLPELAALPAEPPPDLDRVAIARAALDGLDYTQRLDLFLERPGEVLLAHAVLTQRHQRTERPSSVG
jgi:hypothetical protein